jgi:hypothetical protein
VSKAIIALLLGSFFSTLAAQERSDSSGVSKLVTVAAAADSGWVSLQSNPEGAEVYEDTVFIGKTPLVRFRVDARNRIFRLFYPGVGYWGAVMEADSVSVRPGMETTSMVDLTVPSAYGPRREYVPTTETNPDLFLAASDHGNSRLWMGYAAGATMVISGFLSAYIKTKSNKDFDSYVATGDPGLLSSTQRLDRLAGVSLFVTEISLGTLIYLLLTD